MHPISHNNKVLPPRLDDTSVLLLGRGQNPTDVLGDKTDSPLLSPSIEITGYDMPASIMVPMINREEEVLLVVQRNPDFFVQLQQQVDEPTFKKFTSTLYAPRLRLNDQDWLWRIEKLLVKISPPMWEKFQVLVDHFPADQQQQPNIHTPPSPSPVVTPIISTPTFLSARPPLLAQLKEQQNDKSSCSSSSNSTGASSFRYLYEDHGYFFDPRIRNRKSWQSALDPFLQECKLAMKHAEYRLFVHWLFVSSSQVTDEHWECALYESLNHHPILFLKLKDWIDNQVESGENNNK